jgi:uncharacterized membrane protein YfcA
MPEPATLALGAAILVIAFLYSSVGHAGASGYLAAMALVGVSPEVMKPTALSLNVLVASITTIQFARAGHFSWPLFWPLAAASIPAAFLGGWIVLPAAYYRPLIGVVLLFSAWRMAVTSRRPETATRLPPRPQLLLAGGLLGFAAGLTGTGGGIFLSPLLLLCGWAGAKRTSAVSAVFILVNSVSGIAGLVAKTGALPGAIPLWAACALAGGVVGSTLGARRFDPGTLRRLLAVVLVIAGAKLLMN